MIVYFDFLSEPITFDHDFINVLCLENPEIFVKVLKAFYFEMLEENNIIFSDNLKAIKPKGNIDFIQNYLELNMSAAFIKKLYANIAGYCKTELPEETFVIEREIFDFLERINEEYDFDLTYKDDFDFNNFFKFMEVKPDINKERSIECLLDYILLMKKYLETKCFVLSCPHLYFSQEDLKMFYHDIKMNEICILVIESGQYFDKMKEERLYVLDKDLCEIR